MAKPRKRRICKNRKGGVGSDQGRDDSHLIDTAHCPSHTQMYSTAFFTYRQTALHTVKFLATSTATVSDDCGGKLVPI